MKRYLILFLLIGAGLLSACSSDDDGDTTEKSVVATWNLTATNPPGVIPLDGCPSKPEITFNENGTAVWTFYDSQQNCEPASDEAEWVQNSNGTYTVTIPGYGPFTGTVEFQGDNQFIFSTSYQNFPVSLTFQK